MKVKIALLVGSNGKAAAMTLDGVDWGILMDSIMDWEPNRKPQDPDASKKFIVEVDVEVPKTTTITGSIAPAEGG